MFGCEGHPTPLGAAFAQYGRIDRHLLALVDPMDDTYRCLMSQQLTVEESHRRLARAACHGGRGQIRQAYRDGQEDHLASPALLLNTAALWNTATCGSRRPAPRRGDPDAIEPNDGDDCGEEWAAGQAGRWLPSGRVPVAASVR